MALIKYASMIGTLSYLSFWNTTLLTHERTVWPMSAWQNLQRYAPENVVMGAPEWEKMSYYL
jgi:hypothetical protein